MSPPNPSRRAFLGGAVATLAAGPRLAAADRAPVVDTHLHCFAGKGDPRFPYHKNAPYTPDAATPEHLLKCMGEAGVDFAVVVHPEPYQDDHRYLEYCLAVGKGKLKGTCLFFADHPNTPKRLAELAKKLPLVAARVHAYAPERLPPFGQAGLRALWKAAGEAAWRRCGARSVVQTDRSPEPPSSPSPNSASGISAKNSLNEIALA